MTYGAPKTRTLAAKGTICSPGGFFNFLMVKAAATVSGQGNRRPPKKVGVAPETVTRSALHWKRNAQGGKLW